jgi:cupin fold WbuC family metalloprotein
VAERTAKYLDPTFLSPLSAKSPSGKAQWNIQGSSGKVTYTFIALQMNSYVRPHCHPNPFLFGPGGAQFVIVLTGKVGFISIDPKTGIMKKKVLSGRGESAVEIPAGLYHSSVALLPNTVILEVMEPGSKKTYLKGSPRPRTPEAANLIKLWTRASTPSFTSPLIKGS